MQNIVIAGSRPGSKKYNIAGVICLHINSQPKLGLKCIVEPTRNVTESIRSAAKYDFIISQSNIDKKFRNANLGIRSMFSLYPESFTMILSKKSGIKKLSDIKGKRVYLSSGESSARLAFIRLIKGVDLTLKDVQLPRGVDMANALCRNEIDVIFSDINHPDQDVEEMVEQCGASILPLDDKHVKDLIDRNDEYIKGEIPGGVYGRYRKNLDTFAIMTNLLATSRVSDDIAYRVTSAIFGSMDKFKLRDRSLLDIDESEMVIMHHGLILPVHSGALKYYREKSVFHKLK